MGPEAIHYLEPHLKMKYLERHPSQAFGNQMYLWSAVRSHQSQKRYFDHFEFQLFQKLRLTAADRRSHWHRE